MTNETDRVFVKTSQLPPSTNKPTNVQFSTLYRTSIHPPTERALFRASFCTVHLCRPSLVQERHAWQKIILEPNHWSVSYSFAFRNEWYSFCGSTYHTFVTVAFYVFFTRSMRALNGVPKSVHTL